MKRQPTQAAQAAKIIRQELKKHAIKGRVTSENYSGGSSINVKLENQLPKTLELVKEFCSKFQYGHFDGMTDMYEHSNSNDDLPQVKHVFVDNELSDELLIEAWEWAKGRFSSLDGAPAEYKDAWNFWTDTGRNGCQFLFMVMNERDSNFWISRKPRQRAI